MFLKFQCLQEAPVIMNAVEQGFDPQKTCELAGLCSGVRMYYIAKYLSVN